MDRTKEVRKGEKNKQYNEGWEKRKINSAQTEGFENSLGKLYEELL